MNTEFLPLAGLMVLAFVFFLVVKTIILRLVKKEEYEDDSIKIRFDGLIPIITKVMFLYFLEWFFFFITKTPTPTIGVATLILAPINVALAYFIEISYAALTT